MYMSLHISCALDTQAIFSTHPLAIQIRDKEQIGMQLTKIKIENLTLDNVISLTSEALGMEDNEESVTSLATIVHRKTEGNAFFV